MVKTYIDFIIDKKNKVITGDFESAYKKFPDAWPSQKDLNRLKHRCLYKHLMNSKTNPIVLDIGCGVGHLTRKFLNFGYDIIGIDISQSAVQLGRKTLGLGERIQEGDLIKGLEFDDATFDFIVCFGVLQFSLEKLDTALYEIKRVTKNSGKVFVSLSLGNEFIGENYCSDFHQFIKFWEKYFIIEGIIFDESKFNKKQIEKIPKLGGDLTVFGRPSNA